MAIRLHESQPVLRAGAPLAEATVGVVLLHGRGATAEDILSLSQEFDAPGVTYLAPSALNSSWYPFSFLAPLQQNQPFLDSALNLVRLVLAELETAGIPAEKTVLSGFSQGACLAMEFAARNARRYGGVIGMSGGVIGPEGTVRDYLGKFDNTPVYLGCSDIDPHIPLERVRETARIFRGMGAVVTEQIFEGAGHTVFPEEIAYFRSLVQSMAD